MKKKLFSSLLTIGLVASLLVGCGNSTVDEKKAEQEKQTIVKEFAEQNLIIKKADINAINSKNLTEALKGKDGQEGIFCFTVTDTSDETKKKEYLLFNGIDKGFKNFEFNLEKNIMKISCTYDSTATNTQELYFVERKADAPLDSIEVNLTKEDGSATIYEF